MIESNPTLSSDKFKLPSAASALDSYEDAVFVSFDEDEILVDSKYGSAIRNIALFARDYVRTNRFSHDTQEAVSAALDKLVNFNATSYYLDSALDVDEIVKDRKKRLGRTQFLARALYQHALLQENREFIDAYQKTVLHLDLKTVSEQEIKNVCEDIALLVK